MGKRSDFERRPKDKYLTPIQAVLPLLKHLPKIGDNTHPGKVLGFAEPCAANYGLAAHIEECTLLSNGFTDNYHKVFICNLACDIEPEDNRVKKKDALELTEKDLEACAYIITNPPWSRPILHQMIEHFSSLRPTWLLFDADWPHTKQSIPYIPYLRKIVPIGRVKWIEDSKYVGKDNACWYLFDKYDADRPTLFYSR